MATQPRSIENAATAVAVARQRLLNAGRSGLYPGRDYSPEKLALATPTQLIAEAALLGEIANTNSRASAQDEVDSRSTELDTVSTVLQKTDKQINDLLNAPSAVNSDVNAVAAELATRAGEPGNVAAYTGQATEQIQFNKQLEQESRAKQARPLIDLRAGQQRQFDQLSSRMDRLGATYGVVPRRVDASASGAKQSGGLLDLLSDGPAPATAIDAAPVYTPGVVDDPDTMRNARPNQANYVVTRDGRINTLTPEEIAGGGSLSLPDQRYKQGDIGYQRQDGSYSLNGEIFTNEEAALQTQAARGASNQSAGTRSMSTFSPAQQDVLVRPVGSAAGRAFAPAAALPVAAEVAAPMAVAALPAETPGAAVIAEPAVAAPSALNDVTFTPGGTRFNFTDNSIVRGLRSIGNWWSDSVDQAKAANRREYDERQRQRTMVR